MNKSVEFEGVSKRYRRPGHQAIATTLKSYILRDAWRQSKGTHRQDAIWALRDVSMTLDRGSTLGVIGRNGSGKSTLLKLVGRILGPDDGRVTINGRVAALIELGAGFHPELTGRENIIINGVILGMSKAQMRARTPDIIKFADIGDFIDYPVRTYSSGMYARLGFAVAINVDADILLIDEILSVGDASFTRKCHTALNHFKAQGKSIVVVTHDLSTVRNWCDEALWLDGGNIKMRGPAGQVVDAYELASAQGAA